MNCLHYCFFILISLVPLIRSINEKCPDSSCWNSYFSIQYPFVLQGQRPQICSNYVPLRCNHSRTILNLPSSGDFFVSEISYYTQTVLLYDPENCLPRRLMNLNLSSSIFTSAYYQNYTFYRCQTSIIMMTGFTSIACLSTYPYTTIASSSALTTDMMSFYGCTIITTATLPVSWLGQFDGFGIYGDLKLTWDVPRCEDCEQFRETDRGQSNWSKIFQSPLFIPSVAVLCIILIAACLICPKKISDLNRASANNDTEDIAAPPLATTSAVALPPQSTGGATRDDSKVETYTICMIVEEKSGTSCPQGSTCTVCLEDYRKGERIKCIVLCQHCFHANCIDQWLQKSWSCQVCRTSLS